MALLLTYFFCLTCTAFSLRTYLGKKWENWREINARPFLGVSVIAWINDNNSILDLSHGLWADHFWSSNFSSQVGGIRRGQYHSQLVSRYHSSWSEVKNWLLCKKKITDHNLNIVHHTGCSGSAGRRGVQRKRNAVEHLLFINRLCPL